MGNFLSSPITMKESESGKGLELTYGVSCMQGWRSTMEDAHISATSIPEFPDCSLFAVFDGHGGKLIAEHSASELVRYMVKENVDHTSDPEAIGKSIRQTYLSLDAEMRQLKEVTSGEDHSGCTAISAFITRDHVIVANSGDSRSVLASKNTVIPMSEDHKPNNDIEKTRIEKSGGSVRNNRVNGDLAVSRALGDFIYKQRDDLTAEEQQVSAEPEIKIHKRTNDDEFLILACDGIWDVMTNDDACSFVRSLMALGEQKMDLIAEEMLDHCLSLGSRDNMSVIIVKFKGAKIESVGEGVAGIRRERERLNELAKKESENASDSISMT